MIEILSIIEWEIFNEISSNFMKIAERIGMSSSYEKGKTENFVNSKFHSRVFMKIFFRYGMLLILPVTIKVTKNKKHKKT